MAARVLKFLEMDGCTILTPDGRAELTPQQAEAFSRLLPGGRVCRSDLIENYASLTPAERMRACDVLLTQLGQVRHKVRRIGLDVVCITGWGYRLDAFVASETRRTRELPSREELAQLRDIEAGRCAVKATSGLSDFDRERIRNLSARGLSLTGIAAQIRRPYALVAAEMGMA